MIIRALEAPSLTIGYSKLFVEFSESKILLSIVILFNYRYC